MKFMRLQSRKAQSGHYAVPLALQTGAQGLGTEIRAEGHAHIVPGMLAIYAVSKATNKSLAVLLLPGLVYDQATPCHVFSDPVLSASCH